MERSYYMNDLVKVLHDGSKEEIESLTCSSCGSHIYYDFDNDGDVMSMTVGCDCRRIAVDKIQEMPNCVKYFGNSTDFKEEK